jgi:hypothetical protein
MSLKGKRVNVYFAPGGADALFRVVVVGLPSAEDPTWLFRSDDGLTHIVMHFDVISECEEQGGAV